MFAPIALAAALAFPAAAQRAAEQPWCEITVGFEGGRPVVSKAALAPSPSSVVEADGNVLERLDQAIARLRTDLAALPSATATDAHPLPWRVAAARPSHLFYTAQTVFWKMHRQAAWATNAACVEADPAVDDVGTLHVVVNIVERANQELRRMLDEASTAPVADGRLATGASAARQAGSLLTHLLAASRQLDALLPMDHMPSAIYDRLLEALRQLGGLTEEALPPLPTPSDDDGEGKSVTDVYQRVFRCLRLSQVLEVKRNLETERGRKFALSQWHGVDSATNAPSLQIEAARGADRAGVDRSHVYDLATLVIAHLASLGEGDSRRPVAYARPSLVRSSDVYRLAGVLESQLLKMTGIKVPE